jgi:hypothetical protein
MDSEFPGEPRRPRPFDPDRYSPARVSVFLQFPGDSLRAFMVASALGNILDGDGSRQSLKSAKDATGVAISKRRGEVIIGELGITRRHWRRLVHDWELRYLAHRCERGVVVLFTRPFLDECPACHNTIEGNGEAPSMKPKPRGRPFEAKRTDYVLKEDALRPQSGADVSSRAAQIGPLSGTNAPHPTDGVAMRDEEGMEEEVAIQRPEEGSTEDRRDRESEAWPVPVAAGRRRGTSRSAREASR